MPDDDPSSLPKTVRFVYDKSDDYTMSFINGVIGGFNAQGELICNFYFESMEMPKEQEGRIEGKELKVDDIPSPMVFKREMKCGIIMTPQQIYAVRGWLDEKITEFEKKFKMNK